MTGIAMCQNATVVEVPTSAVGYKPSCQEGAEHDSNTLDSGSQSPNVSFLTNLVCSTSDSRLAKCTACWSGDDPKPTFGR